MVENRPWLNALTHLLLIFGIIVVIFPIYIALVTSTHEAEDILTTVQPWFGSEMLENYETVLQKGKVSSELWSEKLRSQYFPHSLLFISDFL